MKILMKSKLVSNLNYMLKQEAMDNREVEEVRIVVEELKIVVKGQDQDASLDLNGEGLVSLNQT